MMREHFAAHRPVIGGECEVAIFVQHLGGESGPATVDLPTAYFSPQNKHHIGVAVIGAAAAVFPCGATEFGHGKDDNILYAIAEILIESSEAVGEFLEPIGHLSGGATFGDMGVPAFNFMKREFQPHIGFDEPGDLFEPQGKPSGRIFGRAGRNLPFYGAKLRQRFE